MSIVSLTGDLTGKAVVYNGVVITKIDISEKFVNSIPHPMPTKQFLSEDDIASIICEILPNKAEAVLSYDRVDTKKYGTVLLFEESFKYHNTDGLIEFSVRVRNSILVIDSITFNVTKNLQGTVE